MVESEGGTLSKNCSEDLFKGLARAPHNLIEALRKVQAVYGYLPPEGIKLAANYVGVPFAQAYSVATFYHQYSLEPIGKYRILVCMGTACHLSGNSLNIEFLRNVLGLKQGQKTTRDRLFSVEEARCFGCCGLAPVIVVQKPDGSNEIIGRANPRSLRATLERYRRLEAGEKK
ncbi:MAG: NAD(P)H-dependent oxidoreductase subunit E [Thermofilaceae archaeon]|nr:NAD(P)H-dependent oxidoreductase subunit E [Thermofilaceae archaeon]MDW8004760.1 NAD(P)H-dependent oxidoreductase subunit E [Thermofilaceae archaeon]